MNKVLITTLLLCTGLITAGCEKTYSVAEFKKDEKLRQEWAARCDGAGDSINCQNVRIVLHENMRKDFREFYNSLYGNKNKQKTKEQDKGNN
ncbi:MULTISPECIES: EexN family lipoprotein [unclassified Bartonella]|uniref:EexN family lipoprotein n=1 Tax=unclassified Bartonella TaxID=2645622 RepID=UPI0035D02C0A